MTKEEILETLIRSATDKCKGTQGVIIIVAQDSEHGFDMTAATVNMNRDGASICLRKLLEKHERGQTNGLIITGRE